MTRDEQDVLINLAVDIHFAKSHFRIHTGHNALKRLKKWLKQNEITEYQIIELFNYISFNNHKDAVIFRLSHPDNELIER